MSQPKRLPLIANTETPQLLVLAGDAGRGKTLIAQWLLQQLVAAEAPAWVWDASDDGALTQQCLSAYQLEHPPIGLQKLLQAVEQQPQLQGLSLDHLLAEGWSEWQGQVELLPVGPLAHPLSPVQASAVSYALGRALRKQAGVTLSDGFCRPLHQALADQLPFSCLWVLSPEDLNQAERLNRWVKQASQLGASQQALLLNHSVPLNGQQQACLDTLQAEGARLIGRLPTWATLEERLSQLPSHLSSALSRLNWAGISCLR